jgi:hypothetical protein
MPTTIKGVHCPSLRILKGVLNEWIATNLRIVREWRGDVPWWYNERASLSVLAGAVWRKGGLVFEEFVADKRSGERPRPKYSGRNDLYLKVGEYQFIAEAKQCWSGAVRVNEKTAGHIQQKLNEACADIRRCPRNGQRKLGVLFAAPYIASSEKNRVDQHIGKWVAFIKTVKCSCSAWVFPKESRHLGAGNICPGVAVLIKEV